MRRCGDNQYPRANGPATRPANRVTSARDPAGRAWVSWDVMDYLKGLERKYNGPPARRSPRHCDGTERPGPPRRPPPPSKPRNLTLTTLLECLARRSGALRPAARFRHVAPYTRTPCSCARPVQLTTPMEIRRRNAASEAGICIPVYVQGAWAVEANSRTLRRV